MEGNSVRATCRLAGAAKGTVLKLLGDIGRACAEYQDAALRGLRCRRIQCDEISSFCYAKAKHVPAEKPGEFGYGDVWTRTAIDGDSKLAMSWLVGSRDSAAAFTFIDDERSRLAHRVQLTTDGHRPYIEAVEEAFGADIDYATVEKIYASPANSEQIRHSPGTRRAGKPDDENEHETVQPPDQRVLEEGRESRQYRSPAFHGVQLRSRPPDARQDSGDDAGVVDHAWTPLEIAALLDKSN